MYSSDALRQSNNGDDIEAGATVGAVGRAARGVVRHRVPQTNCHRIVDSFEAGEDYLQINRIST